MYYKSARQSFGQGNTAKTVFVTNYSSLFAYILDNRDLNFLGGRGGGGGGGGATLRLACMDDLAQSI